EVPEPERDTPPPPRREIGQRHRRQPRPQRGDRLGEPGDLRVRDLFGQKRNDGNGGSHAHSTEEVGGDEHYHVPTHVHADLLRYPPSRVSAEAGRSPIRGHPDPRGRLLLLW